MTLRQKLFTGLKILVILILVILIGLISVIHWRGDAILREVTRSVERQLQDTMTYADASINWLSHFPATSIRFDRLTLGHPDRPLIREGNIDLILPLLPLLRNKIVLHSVRIADAEIDIHYQDDRWSYALWKVQPDQDADTTQTTDLRKLLISNCTLRYDDGADTRGRVFLRDAEASGRIGSRLTELTIRANGDMHHLETGKVKVDPASPFSLAGMYALDSRTGTHQFDKFTLENPGLQLAVSGRTTPVEKGQEVNFHFELDKSHPDSLLRWLPASMTKAWKRYQIAGDMSGTADIQGLSSAKTSPRVQLDLMMHKGVLSIAGQDDPVDKLTATLNLDTQDPDHRGQPTLHTRIERNGWMGSTMTIEADVHNLDQPVITLHLDGPVPGTLFNLADSDRLNVSGGFLRFDNLRIQDYRYGKQAALHALIPLIEGEITLEDIACTYAGKHIAITRGQIRKEDAHQLSFDMESLTWHKATATGVSGEVSTSRNQIVFAMKGKFGNGEVDMNGQLSGMAGLPVAATTWKIREVDIRQVLASFDDFGQSFITSQHLSGTSTIWADVRIPMDKNWHIRPQDISAVSALEIRNGRLQGLKTLEDFSQYIHVEDLRDIRFQQLRNYLRIERGEIYLPVMFIQSTAVNLSVSGRHGFDQKILYHLKVNAGQTLAQKLKKRTGAPGLKPARKSGWINLYYTLFGTTAQVRYAQDRKAVLAGFEEALLRKEQLRQELVSRFGYDVYWLEPNEWEDVPEYR